MVRLLVLVAIVAIVALIVMKLVKGRASRADRAPGSAPGKAGPDEDAAKLVQCARCGAYVPKRIALPAPDGPRCTDRACAP